MQLSRQFVLFMAGVLVFLLAAFATEDSRCVARARRIFEEMFRPTPAAIAGAQASEVQHFAFAAFGPHARPESRPDIDAAEWAMLAGESCLRPAEREG